MVDFYTTWCGWCKRLDRDTYSDAGVDRPLPKARGRQDRRRTTARPGPEVQRHRLSDDRFPASRRQDRCSWSSGTRRRTPFVAILDRLLDRKSEAFILRQRLKDHPELIDVRVGSGRASAWAGADGRGARAVRHASHVQREEWTSSATGISPWPAGRPSWQSETHARPIARSRTSSSTRSSRRALRKPSTYLGESAIAEGDRKEARKCFRKILEIRQEGWLAGQVPGASGRSWLMLSRGKGRGPQGHVAGDPRRSRS